jgi:hypothetical protein
LLCRNAEEDTALVSLSSPLSAALSTTVLRLPGRAQHVSAIVFDQLTNFSRVHSRLRSDVGHCAAEPNVIADEVHAFGILEQIIDVQLANAKASVDVTTIVRLPTVSHVPAPAQIKVGSIHIDTLRRRKGQAPRTAGAAGRRGPRHQCKRRIYSLSRTTVDERL